MKPLCRRAAAGHGQETRRRWTCQQTSVALFGLSLRYPRQDVFTSLSGVTSPQVLLKKTAGILVRGSGTWQAESWHALRLRESLGHRSSVRQRSRLVPSQPSGENLMLGREPVSEHSNPCNCKCIRHHFANFIHLHGPVMATFLAAFFFHGNYHLIDFFKYDFEFTRKPFKVLIQAPGSHMTNLFTDH